MLQIRRCTIGAQFCIVRQTVVIFAVLASVELHTSYLLALTDTYCGATPYCRHSCAEMRCGMLCVSIWVYRVIYTRGQKWVDQFRSREHSGLKKSQENFGKKNREIIAWLAS